MKFEADAVGQALHRLFIGVDGTSLRKEDRQKAQELAPLLEEVARAAKGASGLLLDACAGKSALGLLAAELVLAPGWRVCVLERDAARVLAAVSAVALAGASASASARALQQRAIEIRQADVQDASAWPNAPDVVVALHACGPASDAIIDRAAQAGARHLLLVPCCYGASPKNALADHPIQGQRLLAPVVDVLPRQALPGRRLAAAIIDIERTLRLEALGYDVDVVEFCAATTTPHNLLWRCRLSKESVRMAAAQTRLDGLQTLLHVAG